VFASTVKQRQTVRENALITGNLFKVSKISRKCFIRYSMSAVGPTLTAVSVAVDVGPCVAGLIGLIVPCAVRGSLCGCFCSLYMYRLFSLSVTGIKAMSLL